MINFIVCEDNKIILQRNVDIINKLMFNNNLSYRIYSFTKYDDELEEIINTKGDKKVYILDIELEDTSGIELAQKIRKNDIESFIVFSTAHTEYLPYTLKSKLLIYDFVSKFDDYNNSLSDVIKRILNDHLETKKFEIKKGKSITEINFDEIINLHYDSNLRKTVILTKTKEFIENKPFIFFTKDLDDRFKKQKDGSYVNTDIS